MTENEQLKKNAEDSKLRQMHKELDQYMLKLLDRMGVEMRRDRIGSMVYLAGWLSWIVLDLTFPWGKGSWCMIFFLGLVYSNYTTTKLLRTFSELDGVFNTLKILGMMGDMPDPPRKKKRWVMDELVEAVRGWVENIKAEKAKGLSPA